MGRFADFAIGSDIDSQMHAKFEGLVGTAALTMALLAGCASAPRESAAVTSLRLQRRAEIATPLEERVAQIERRLFGDFYEERIGLMTPFLIVRDGRTEKGPVQVEANAHLLIGLACRYAVTHDAETQERARRLLAGLETLDRANGLDGFLPIEARIVDGDVEVTSSRCTSSVYTQLFYADVLAWRLFSDPKIKAEIRTQALRMLDHIVSHGLIVVDQYGRPLPYSDASLKLRFFGTGRELETLSFVRTACFFAQDDPVRSHAWQELRKRMEDDYGYARMPYILHFSTPLLELPTVSSSWLNLMKLATLVETTDSGKYRRLLHDLADDYRSYQNPFFIALDLLYRPAAPEAERLAEERVAWRRLGSYPLTNDSHELQNAGRYHLRMPPHFVKNSLALHATRPIPFYDVPGDAYQWKRDPFLLDGNHGGDGSVVYSGVDCYEAFWLLTYARSAAGR
jgi:hypothetical protein